VLRVVREILYYRPRGRGTDLRAALDHLVRGQKRRAVVFVLSDFLTDGYQRSLRAASMRHDVIALRMRDEREETLPPVGVVAVRDLETGSEFLVDTSSRSVRAGFAARTEEADRRYRDATREARVDGVDLWTHEDAVRPLATFFRRRIRRRNR
jgi:hypothetical protein